MEPTERLLSGRRGGFALIVSMIFVLLFTALALSVATFSSASVVVADNHRQADRARAVAESGLEIVRLWLSKISISGNTPPAERFPQIAALLLDYLAANHTNVTAYYDTDTVYIQPVQLDADNEQRFAAQIRQSGAETIDVVVTGQYRQFSKQIAVKYIFGTRADTVFDFGVATKGPLSLAGNIELEGVKVSVDASVYIESESSSLALSITGNSQIAGDVSIVNPIATVELVGGKAGMAAAAKRAGREAAQGRIEAYVHPGNQVAVLLEVNCETDFVAKTQEFIDFCHEVAMHIAAARPQAVTPEELDPALVAKEKEIYLEQVKGSGKPEKIWDRIIEGRLKKFYAENCLLEQPWVRDGNVTIEELRKQLSGKMGENIVIRRFVRFGIGPK